jgi:hypothetical protein
MSFQELGLRLKRKRGQRKQPSRLKRYKSTLPIQYSLEGPGPPIFLRCYCPCHQFCRACCLSIQARSHTIGLTSIHINDTHNNNQSSG